MAWLNSPPCDRYALPRGSRTPCPPPPGRPPHLQVARLHLLAFARVPLRIIRDAEVPVRPALPRPVAHLLCNRQVLRVVGDGLAEVPLRPIRVAEVPVCPALPRPVAHLLCNRQVIARGSVMAWLKSPCDSYAHPRFPYATPSPARSPTSFAIARCCAWYVMALLKSPCD